ncbi:MAG: hypothetical protein COA45_02905 [Zetaproteobacteria bacterium]|nr:MAG: hypothetical protein COA45_02905 [Zetaproteobacteria bacterium]
MVLKVINPKERITLSSKHPQILTLILIIAFSFCKPSYANDQKLIEKKNIKRWAIEAVRDVMTYNYQNYKERQQQNSSYFTVNGWANISQALDRSGIIDMVIEDKLSLMSFQADLAEVCNMEEKEGTRIWSVVVPIKVIYSSEDNKWKKFQTVVVFIVETIDDEKKISKKAIYRWMAGVKVGEKKPCQSYDEVKVFDKHVEEYISSVEALKKKFGIEFNKAEKENATIKRWVMKTVEKTLSFDYQNYRGNLGKLDSYYTVKGWEAFIKSLKMSRTIERVVTNKLALKSFQYSPALVCHSNEKEASYNWYIVAPIQSVYYNEEKKYVTRKNILIHVNKSKAVAENDAQILIDEWIVESGDHDEPTCEIYKDRMNMSEL